MKTYTVSTPQGPVEVFYDRYLRLWTAYLIDGRGHQDAHAGYGVTKVDAILAATLEWRYV